MLLPTQFLLTPMHMVFKAGFHMIADDRKGSNRSFRQRVSSPTTSSLILNSIRQRLTEGTINTVNRSLCNYKRNQSNTFTAWLEICDRFN